MLTDIQTPPVAQTCDGSPYMGISTWRTHHTQHDVFTTHRSGNNPEAERARSLIGDDMGVLSYP
jgi:hypothetical protein